MSKIVLCADSMSARYPECLGLDGESLLDQDWMRVLSDANEARIAVRCHDAHEVWVAGSDTVDAINLAATLKQEEPASKICLLAFQGSGSLYSRAQAAGIDEVWDKPSFLAHYRNEKSAHCVITPIAALRDTLPAPVADHSDATRQHAAFDVRWPNPAQVQIATPALADAHPAAAGQVPDGMQQAPALVSQPAAVSVSLADGQVAAAEQVIPAEQRAPVSQPALALQPAADPSGSVQPVCGTRTAPAVDRGLLVPVVGAGGGVGKSTVAVVAAYLAQARGYRTVLVDADLQFGDIGYLVGPATTVPLDEAVANPARIQALQPDANTPAILSAPARLEQAEVVAPQLGAVIETLQQQFDVVVVNTSAAWSDVQLTLLEAGGSGIFLLDQRPSSIRACKHALELCGRCGVATQPLLFALNRCSRTSLFSSIDVTCALQGARVVELSEGGRDVEELLGTGAPLELVESGNALCSSVTALLDDILPARQTPAVINMPSRKRFRIGARRKKAACL